MTTTYPNHPLAGKSVSDASDVKIHPVPEKSISDISKPNATLPAGLHNSAVWMQGCMFPPVLCSQRHPLGAG